jgi:tetratricopeptide (TPR) repeat protein
MMHLLSVFLLLAQSGSAGAAGMYSEGRYAEAAAAYREILKADPSSADAWLGMGKSLLQLRNPAGIGALQHALQLKPDDPDLARSVAQIYLEAGNMPGAVALLDPLIEKNPNDAEALYLLGAAMYRGGFYERAAELLGRSMALHADHPDAPAMHAVSLAKAGRTVEAEPACLRLLSGPPSGWNLDVALTYVQILDESGRLDQAMPYVDKVLEQFQQNPIAHFWKARLLFQSSRLDQAAREAELSVAAAPGLPLARNLLVQIYRRQGRTDDAERQAAWLREYNDRLAGKDR